eukprot:15443459-Alexandrium_andersonii.AAC.1
MGAVLGAKALSHSILGHHEAAPQVALSGRSRPKCGARREAPRKGFEEPLWKGVGLLPGPVGPR